MGTMPKVKHYKMYEYNVNSLPISEGQIIYTIDTGKVFLDVSSDIRIQITNVYKCTESERGTINPITNGIYYITDSKTFYFYDGSNWVGFGEKDKLGNDIAATYIKDITISGDLILFTRGDGTTGTVGVKGRNGASWLYIDTVGSVGDTAPTDSNVGDIVLDSNCNLFKVNSSSKLEYLTNIKGIKGDKGDPGEQGSQGEPGDKIKIGDTLSTAVEYTIFFKVV